MAKAAKKEIKIKPKAKATQDTVKAVAFGVKVPAKKAKVVKFKPGQRVTHQELGAGEFKHYTNPTYEDAAVLFDDKEFEQEVVSVALLLRVQGHKFKLGQSVAHKEGQVGIVVGLEYESIRVKIDAQTGETRKWLGADCTTVKKALAAHAKSKSKPTKKATTYPKSPEAILKRQYGLKIGDRVYEVADKIGTILSVNFGTFENADKLFALVNFTDDLNPVPIAASTLSRVVDAKLRFGDVAVFSPFVVSDSTFVKVGNSTAIAAQVRGTSDEPFAMLVTPVALLNKDAKRSFKQSDKVLPYSPTA